jgi:hypothetical protein
MAIGAASDFVIRDELFRSSFLESQTQTVDLFNASSANTIRLVTESQQGDYAKDAFVDRMSGGYVRRDTTDTSTSLTPSAITQDEIASVKRNKRYGPYSQTRDAFIKANMSPESFSVLLAQNMVEEKMVAIANDAIIALKVAIRAESGSVYDYAATGSNATIDHTALIRGRGLMLDKWGKVKAWVMNGASYAKLVEAQVSAASGNVADIAIFSGAAASLGLPTMVTDASTLTTSGTPGEYHILGLTENACVVTLSESPLVATDLTLLKPNIELVFQAEDAYNVGLKGFTWDVTNGGVNPSDATFATATNWDYQFASMKDGPGVAIDVDIS